MTDFLLSDRLFCDLDEDLLAFTEHVIDGLVFGSVVVPGSCVALAARAGATAQKLETGLAVFVFDGERRDPAAIFDGCAPEWRRVGWLLGRGFGGSIRREGVGRAPWRFRSGRLRRGNGGLRHR